MVRVSLGGAGPQAPGSSHRVPLLLQDDALLDDIIDRLLDVRTGRPGKQVALSETEVRLPRRSRCLPLPAWPPRTPRNHHLMRCADSPAVPHSQGDFHEPAQPAGARGSY